MKKKSQSLTCAGGETKGLWSNINSSKVSIFLNDVGIVEILLLEQSRVCRDNLEISGKKKIYMNKIHA